MQIDRYPTTEERAEAHQLAKTAKSLLENPYWPEYPKDSKKGPKDEILSRQFVDCYCGQCRCEWRCGPR